jgi:hypothetical protein
MLQLVPYAENQIPASPSCCIYTALEKKKTPFEEAIPQKKLTIVIVIIISQVLLCFVTIKD